MIILKSPQEIAIMREGNRILARLFEHLAPLIQPGITTAELDKEAELFIRSHNAAPAFKGYRGYPATLCTSVNEEVIHGIPSGRILQEGDIVSLDFGVLFEGFYSDSALTAPVGRAGAEALRLIAAAERSFVRGLEQMKEGNRLSDISAAIQESVESEGFSVVRQFVGHGIGRALHEEPPVPNFGAPGRGPKIKPGMTLAIEPMIAAGGAEVVILEDGWTAVTRDRSLAAHFEHTVAMTENGPEVLSARTPDAARAGTGLAKEVPHA